MDESDGIEGRFCSEDQSKHKQVSILFKVNCFDINLKWITHEFSIYLIKQMGSNLRKPRFAICAVISLLFSIMQTS